MDHHPDHQLLNNNGSFPRNSSFHKTPPSNPDRQPHDRHPLLYRTSFHLPYRQAIQTTYSSLHHNNKKNLHSRIEHSLLPTQMEFLTSNRSSDSIRSLPILIHRLNSQRHDKKWKTTSILTLNKKNKMIVISIFYS